jgi:hypothetical protein
VFKLSKLEVEGHADQLTRDDCNIHSYVFSEFEVFDMFTVLKRRYALAFAAEHIANNHNHETVVVARLNACHRCQRWATKFTRVDS